MKHSMNFLLFYGFFVVSCSVGRRHKNSTTPPTILSSEKIEKTLFFRFFRSRVSWEVEKKLENLIAERPPWKNKGTFSPDVI